MTETISFRPSKKNTKIIIDLKKLANQENRNLNNYIENVLLDHLKQKNATV